MDLKSNSFNEQDVIHRLKHYLPAQAPLKDFIHHNTLHAFQDLKFHRALHHASEMFGYKVSLSLNEYRTLYTGGRIREEVLARVLRDRLGPELTESWQSKLLHKQYDMSGRSRIGALRSNWKKHYDTDLDVLTHPILFRTLCSYLDQGIAIWNFPVLDKGFLNSVREMEKHTYSSFFKSRRVKALLNTRLKIADLLKIIVGDASLYSRYLFDQQFAHQGWSGMVSVVEDNPESLLDAKKISLKDLIMFELLLEIDALDTKFGEIWSPLGFKLEKKPAELFADVPETEYSLVMSLWQDAYEWSYYDEVLAGLLQQKKEVLPLQEKSFQATFCIDDREISLRDHLERTDQLCETFATPGFFGVEFFFQPEYGRSYTKQCPANVTPRFLIREVGVKNGHRKDLHFAKHTHGLIRGLFIAPTFGFWSALRLLLGIFKPSLSPATSLALSHMDKSSHLTILNTGEKENDLQVGFTVEQMADRVEALLKSIGLTGHFAPLLYFIGHGASSTNNPHYAAYNCGACCGSPGSVNARVIAFMGNQPEVRALLQSRGLAIPPATQFIGALHDTTRDEILFYDEEILTSRNLEMHRKNKAVFARALDLNAKERSRRFALIDTRKTAASIHKDILRRSVSLFEPRPELNHATNALCIIGPRALTRHLFLDRRAFTNSYDHSIDPEGKLLAEIMKPIGPVCGGINLEYFFSRVDNEKLGAGTKLPHNVMGLFGVANGFDGDLRPGLPSQMIEVHDPVRLLVIVEHIPEVVLRTIQSSDSMYEWFINEWVHLVVIHPATRKLSVFRNGAFSAYVPLHAELPVVKDITPIIETHTDNIPVYLVS